MANIGNIAVVISANAGPLNAGLNSAARSVNTFAASIRTPGANVSVAMQQAQQGVANVARQAQASQGSLGGLAGAAGAIHPALSGLALLANPLTAGIAAAGAAATYAVGQFASFENTSIVFETMLGSAEKAKTYLADLQQFAARTPFQFQDLTTGAQRLIAVGFSAEKARDMMEPLGNLAAAMPGNMSESFERIVRAVGQMHSKGRVNAEEMGRQLGEAGIPAWKALADHMGMSVAEVRKLSEQGKIAAETGIEAILNLGRSEKFGGMMNRQSQTLTGLWSTAKDNWQMFNIGVGEAIAKGSNLHGVMRGLIAEMGKFAEDKSFEKGIGEMANVAAGAANSIGALTAAVKGLNNVFKKDFSMEGGVFGAVAKLLQYTPNLASGGTALEAMVTGGEGNWWSTALRYSPNLYAAGYWGSRLLDPSIDDVVTIRQTAMRRAATAATEQQAQASGRWAAVSMRAAMANDALNKSVVDLHEELRVQAATFGMSAGQVKIWQLEQKGAGAEQLKMLRAQTAANEYLQEMTKLDGSMVPALNIYDEFLQLLDDIRERGRTGFLNPVQLAGGVTALEEAFKKKEYALGLQYTKTAATPFDTFYSSVQELSKLQERGLIGAEVADSGLVKAFGQLDGAFKLGEAKLPDALQEGSKAALSFIARRSARGAETVQEKIARTLEDQKRLQKEVVDYEREVATALRQILGKVGPVQPAKF